VGIASPSGPTGTVDRESCARKAPAFSRAHLASDCLVTPGTDGLLMHSVALTRLKRS
jgi:hypothetical protein